MGFMDVLKNTILEGFSSKNIPTVSALVCLGMAVIFGLIIYFVYRQNCQGGFYDRGFNKSLVILPVITAGIILAMRSNVLISLGMVGALSIVRFRNAVKEPMDLTYMFWSISVGLVTGIGLFELAIVITVCITALIFGLEFIPTLRDPFILVVNAETAAVEKKVIEAAQKYSSRVRVRSRNLTRREAEWILELKTRNPEALMENVSAVESVISLNLLSHDGDVRF